MEFINRHNDTLDQRIGQLSWRWGAWLLNPTGKR